MMPQSRLLPDGKRLHLQHGPIDLILSAEGPGRRTAFVAAEARFTSLLTELVSELPALREPMTPDATLVSGDIALRMDRAARPLSDRFVTRMAAVAGAVADTVLEAMLDAAPLTRAYVNNGGDIALHLSAGRAFVTAMQSHDGADLGRIRVESHHHIGGIATSGRHGRSLSLGIADSVTVLASSAAQADVAATLIANAVDIAGHSVITRTPAHDLDPDSDLGARLVVTGCGALNDREIANALNAGHAYAQTLQAQGHIAAAALHLQGETRILGPQFTAPERSLLHV